MKGDQIDREGWSVYLKYTVPDEILEQLPRLLLLDEAETNEMYDLAAKSRNTISADLPDYIMKKDIVGGGGCMIRNFAEYNERRITVNDDICATAKGYERMLEMKLIKNGGAL